MNIGRKIPDIGITLGDPAGIGPEVALRALGGIDRTKIRPVIIGRKSVMETHYRNLLPEDLYSAPASGNSGFPENTPVFIDVECDYPVPEPGQGSVETGAESLLYIKAAIELWKAGRIDAITTGPVHKGFIEKSGTPFTGHTEYIAGYIGEPSPYMMMFSPRYRVLLATTHVPLSSAAGLVPRERLLDVIRIGYDSIRAIDGGDVRLAVTGFDPHCGDDGAIGDFDLRITAPAIAKARAGGIPVEGPFSAEPSLWLKNGRDTIWWYRIFMIRSDSLQGAGL